MTDSGGAAWDARMMLRNRSSQIAIVALAVPTVLALFVSGPLFLVALAPAFAFAGHFGGKAGWPHARMAATVGIIGAPILGVFARGMPWQGFLVMCGISALSYAGFIYGPRLARKAAPSPAAIAPQSAALAPEVGNAAPAESEAETAPSPAQERSGVAPSRPPVIATTTRRQTAEGTEYTIGWTDFTKLAFWDEHRLLYVLPVITVYLLFSTAMAYGEIGRLFTLLTWASGIAAVGLWIYKFWHERRRYSVRSLVLSPDGSIFLNNPPGHDVNHETNGPPLLLANALSRLTSIEYTKTADWSWIMPQRVRSADHWYDVHLFLGEEWRITISRNLGSRDHAHQIAGHLNRLKAELTRPRAVSEVPMEAPRLD